MTGAAQEGARARRALWAEGSVRLAALCIIVVVTVSVLSLGAPIFLPIVEALLVWFVVNALAESLRRLPRVGAALSERQARWIAAGLMMLAAIVAVYSGVWSVASFGPQAMQLQSSLDPLVRGLAALLGPETGAMIDRAFDAVGLEALVRQIVLGLLGLINQFGIIAIYVAFLLIDQAHFPAKLRLLIPDPERHAAAVAVLSDLRRQIGAYLWIMTKVSAATALLSLVAMLIAGLENPLFWAMLVFLLNFIPTIGSVLGTLLPAVFALVQFQDIGTAALLALALGTVQFTIGSILLPRMAGKTLNLSLTLTIVCLFVWGAIWGVTGMLLAVPLTASLLLIASRFESTRWIAIAASRTGELFAADGAVAAAHPARHRDPDPGDPP
jgi:predicted PurR-regulated permease PerM